MPKVKISEYSATANSNTDVASINIDEGCAPSGINNAIRAIMGHLKDFQQGTNGDPFNGPVNGTVGATTPNTGAFTTLSATGTITSTLASGEVLGNSTATTGTAYINFHNTSGQMLLGVDNSAGTGLLTSGAIAYATVLTTATVSPIIFGIAQAGKMVLDTSGNLLVGATSSTGSGASSGKQVVQFNGAATNGIYLDDTRTASGIDNALIFGRGANTVGSIDTDLTLFRVRAVGELVFASNSTNAGRFDTSGNLMVGTTSAIQSGKYSCSFAGNVSNGIVLQTTYASTGTDFVRCVNSAGTAIGNITQNGATTVAYNTSSDYRLKNTITAMTGALAKVALLKPVTYKWNADGSNGEGFIAHELAEVVPDCVSGEKDAVDADGNPKYQGIDTSFLVATLTAAIQELKAEFDVYKASHP